MGKIIERISHLGKAEVKLEGQSYWVDPNDVFIQQQKYHEKDLDDSFWDFLKEEDIPPEVAEPMQREHERVSAESWRNCVYYFKLRNGFL